MLFYTLIKYTVKYFLMQCNLLVITYCDLLMCSLSKKEETFLTFYFAIEVQITYIHKQNRVSKNQ